MLVGLMTKPDYRICLFLYNTIATIMQIKCTPHTVTTITVCLSCKSINPLTNFLTYFFCQHVVCREKLNFEYKYCLYTVLYILPKFMSIYYCLNHTQKATIFSPGRVWYQPECHEHLCTNLSVVIFLSFRNPVHRLKYVECHLSSVLRFFIS